MHTYTDGSSYFGTNNTAYYCFIFAVLAVVPLVVGTSRCNLQNFALAGGSQCGLQWWQSRDLGQIVDVTYKASEIVKDTLNQMGQNYSEINNSLKGVINATSVDPLAKIIESVLTVEPYTAFVIADLLVGFDITANELQQFGLPEDLASKDNLVKMFTEYFDVSCSE